MGRIRELGGSSLDYYTQDSSAGALGGYSIASEPLQDLSLTGIPSASGNVGSDSSADISQSTGLVSQSQGLAQDYADTTNYVDDSGGIPDEGMASYNFDSSASADDFADSSDGGDDGGDDSGD